MHYTLKRALKCRTRNAGCFVTVGFSLWLINYTFIDLFGFSFSGPAFSVDPYRLSVCPVTE